MVDSGYINCNGYHTCEKRGDYASIVEGMPFLSGNGDDQWLTQGYYFWTDSDYWAKKWKKKPRVIGYFRITLHESELLDLVGNVNHQLLFLRFAEIFRGKSKEGNSPTVHEIVKFLRKHKKANGLFPYKAVKAMDVRFDDSFPFTMRRKEKLPLVTRQQLCVFEGARSAIKFVKFVEPKEFTS